MDKKSQPPTPKVPFLVRLYSFIILLLSLSACSDKQVEKWKNSYVKRELPEEVFLISTAEDTILESSKSSVIYVPKDAFIDKEGKPWTEDVKVSLSELNTAAELTEHNISSASDDGALGIHHFMDIDATSIDGNTELFINPASAPYVEVLIEKDAGALKSVTGEEDEHGYIIWKKPKKIPSYLHTQPFSTLDFLPEGFESTLNSFLPYKGHVVPSKILKDSLYFALDSHEFAPMRSSFEGDVAPLLKCGRISPALIQTIQEKKFANTFLATKAFETRLKVLFEIGNDKYVQLYLENLNKEMWEVDQLVAGQLEGKYKERFTQFANEKLGNVKGMKAKMAKKLGSFYSKRWKANEQKLQNSWDDYQKELKKKSDLAKKKLEEYKSILRKRQEYRLRRQGIVYDKKSPHSLVEVLDKLEKFVLKVEVPNGPSYDRVQVYIEDLKINSLYALLSGDKITFDTPYKEDWAFVTKKNANLQAVVIGYKDGKKFKVDKAFTQQKINIITVPLPDPSIDKPMTDKAFKKSLAQLDKGHRRFNSIEVDLAYQQFFEEERKRIEQVAQEQMMMNMLYLASSPKCEGVGPLVEVGREIFENNCISCHAINEKVVGPALYKIGQRRTFQWLVQMTKYPQKLIDSGDPIARKQYLEYKQYMPNHDFLRDEEIFGIILYIEEQSR